MQFSQVAAFAASLLLVSAPAAAQCSTSQCTTGALGNGGQASDGRAQGFRYVGPGPINPSLTLTHDGRSSSGHVELLDANGNVLGTLNGHCESGTFVWNGTGTGFFGDWTGSSDLPFIPCD